MQPISRRQALRGLGVTVALPFLQSLLPRGARAAAPVAPRRMIIFYTPCGMYMPSWTPTASGPELPATLPPILAPLQDFRNDILLVNGLTNQAAVAQYKLPPPQGDGKDHHAMSTSTLLTGQVTFPGNPGADSYSSVDQAAARVIGASTPFASLQLGLPQTYSCDSNDQGPFNCAHMQNISWADPATPLHPMTDPQAVFSLMFANAAASPADNAAATAQRRAAKKSVLDSVLAQASRVSSQLARDDRLKLDQYLTGVRSLEQQLGASAQQNACAGPSLVAGADLDNQMKNFSALIAMAFACDLTRVVTFMCDSSKSGRNYNFMGVNFAHHERSHSSDGKSLTAIGAWEMTQLGRLLSALKQSTDGDKSLLDQTALLAINELSAGGSHSPNNLPILLAGRAGGAWTPGRQVTLTGAPDSAGLHVNLLNAVGVGVSTFGNMGAKAFAL